jgi:hypothetical protein
MTRDLAASEQDEHDDRDQDQARRSDIVEHVRLPLAARRDRARHRH